MDYTARFQEWLDSSEVSAEDKARMNALSDKEKKERFFAPLQFGTAGMRGVLDVGVNSMNEFTVRRATKGLADYVNSLPPEAAKRGVVIAYDTRKFSTEFAIEAAKVLAANRINVFLFENVRPVPMCSFAIR